MKLRVGDLVRYFQGPQRLGIVTMVHTTQSGAEVCEVMVVLDGEYPEEIGRVKYLNQDYWRKAEALTLPLDQAIEGKETEYEETIDLHKTHGES
jgi:hypothetical protein